MEHFIIFEVWKILTIIPKKYVTFYFGWYLKIQGTHHGSLDLSFDHAPNSESYGHVFLSFISVWM